MRELIRTDWPTSVTRKTYVDYQVRFWCTFSCLVGHFNRWSSETTRDIDSQLIIPGCCLKPMSSCCISDNSSVVHIAKTHSYVTEVGYFHDSWCWHHRVLIFIWFEYDHWFGCVSTDVQPLGLFMDEWAISGDILYFTVFGDCSHMVLECFHPFAIWPSMRTQEDNYSHPFPNLIPDSLRIVHGWHGLSPNCPTPVCWYVVAIYG